ncbi:PTS sugar transporter subunit IIA [uncultured Psychrosphaera sp.]|jgi:PTS system nitrogen regulatory IIA component|uniref:PTS sugar transporter subunit IIA n=1 Tax=uncultured Psychrosphaera sp. TaxID=1403522 RepID=UPI00261C9AFC|nr:PTS sugar transporter subunit IIA [uncultured Psychrosphaera sp.]
MNLKFILQPESTKRLTDCASKKKVLEKIALLASEQLPDHSFNDILESLMSRERLGSTGIGNGIAIPHGKLTNIKKAVAVFLVSADAISYDAIDKRPVDIFCALLVPADQCDTHLSTLASIAKLLDNKETVKKIRRAESDLDLYNILEAA